MFIMLTNTSSDHKGKPIAIKKDSIVSVYASSITTEDGKKKTQTFIYAPPHGTYEVREKVEEVVSQLNGA